MRRNLSVAAATAGLMVMVAGGIAGARASSPGAAEGRTMTVVQRAPDQAFQDFGAPGPTPGDILVFRSALFDETNTTPLGDLHIQCVVSFGNKAVCVGIFSFTGRGQLAVDALPEFPLPATGIVTGGSGEFQRTRGQADIEPQPDGTTVITFHLFG